MFDVGPKWVFTKIKGPETRSSRLYFFDSGDNLGSKEDDGHTYYRLNCSYWFGDWIETQDTNLWRAYGGPHRAIYIVRDDLMMLIKLKWE